MSLNGCKGQFRKLQNTKHSGKQMLYLMRSINGLYKIGISKDPSKRAKALTTATGYKVILLCSWKTPVDAFIIEKTLHGMFTESRKEGEWFDFGGAGEDVFYKVMRQSFPLCSAI